MKNEIFETLVKGTRDYLEKNGLSCMVLGVSGGIDSTLVAAICHEVEKQNPSLKFYGISLPCKTNKAVENMSAMATLDAFCKEENKWIQSIENQYIAVSVVAQVRMYPSKLQLGNIKARLRMIYLYNWASCCGGVVMDTDNLTEHNLGFYTLHGDQGDLNPIGMLWKHEIYELVSWLKDYYYTNDQNKIDALSQALQIIPTDGNGVKEGGDLEQIAPGLTYEEVDDILEEYIKTGNKSTKYDSVLVDKVITRHLNTEYKRKGLPILVCERKIIGLD